MKTKEKVLPPIRISDVQKRKLQKKAKEQGMSMSEAIRYLVQKWLES